MNGSGQSRPRIAVAFYGIPRCSTATVPSIEKRLLEPLRACGDVRVFYHLFLQDRIDNPRSGEAGRLDRENYDFVKPYDGVLEPPPDMRASVAYRRTIALGDAYGDDGTSVANLLLQLHGLAAVGSRALEWSPDVVVYARPDLLYHDPVDPNVVLHAARHTKACAVPGWQWYRGCNDRFAICGRDAAVTYSHRAACLEAFWNASRRPVESEALLLFALKRGGIDIVAIPLRASRIRLGDRIYPEQFRGRCLLRPGPLLRLWRARAAYALIRLGGAGA